PTASAPSPALAMATSLACSAHSI
ncbi:unnamed protein product, partial [Calypogeia fissa]